MLPGAVKTRPTPKKSAPSREINPGDKICGQCGEGNDPVRKFCRRCGASLLEAVVFTLPWYKRAWRRLTHRKQKVAGARPKVRRRAIGGSGRGWLTSLLLIIVLVGIGVIALLTFVGPVHKSLHSTFARWYHDVAGDVNPHFTAIHPDGAAATSSLPGHPAGNLIDEGSNTSWQSKSPNFKQLIVVRFAGKTNLGKIGFLNGAQDTPQTFVTQPRPKTIKLTFDGTNDVKTLTLKDTPNFQTYTVSAKGATGVTVLIESVYPAEGGGKNVSMTEIELFSKS